MADLKRFHEAHEVLTAIRIGGRVLQGACAWQQLVDSLPKVSLPEVGPVPAVLLAKPHALEHKSRRV